VASRKRLSDSNCHLLITEMNSRINKKFVAIVLAVGLLLSIGCVESQRRGSQLAHQLPRSATMREPTDTDEIQKPILRT
jgi:hypothetical protein